MGVNAWHLPLALLLAPLLPGLVNRSRPSSRGAPGGPCSSSTSTFSSSCKRRGLQPHDELVFRAGPVVALSTSAAALALVPLGGLPALAAFPGDLILFAYLLALGRFFTVAAALDTGSAFEGMGRAARCGSRPCPSPLCSWVWRRSQGRRASSR